MPNRAATLSSWERAAEAPNRVAPKLTLHDGSERSIEFLMIHSAAGEGFINDIIYPHQNSLRLVLGGRSLTRRLRRARVLGVRR